MQAGGDNLLPASFWIRILDCVQRFSWISTSVSTESNHVSARITILEFGTVRLQKRIRSIFQVYVQRVNRLVILIHFISCVLSLRCLVLVLPWKRRNQHEFEKCSSGFSCPEKDLKLCLCVSTSNRGSESNNAFRTQSTFSLPLHSPSFSSPREPSWVRIRVQLSWKTKFVPYRIRIESSLNELIPLTLDAEIDSFKTFGEINQFEFNMLGFQLGFTRSSKINQTSWNVLRISSFTWNPNWINCGFYFFHANEVNHDLKT